MTLVKTVEFPPGTLRLLRLPPEDPPPWTVAVLQLSEPGFSYEWKLLDVQSAEGLEIVFSRSNENHRPNAGTGNEDEAEVLADGFVKWDGCHEMTVYQVHGCQDSDFAALVDRLRAIRAAGRKFWDMPNAAEDPAS